MSQIIIKSFKSPFGELILGDFDGKLCLADWKYRKMRNSIDQRIKKGLNAEYVEGNSDLIEVAIEQLNNYSEGKSKVFDIPLKMVGTDFQKKVWQALINIPFGETRSYLQLSRELGDEKAIRAVATANGANCISIIIPCHRIIGSNSEMVGYAGGILAKKKLLQLEQKEPFVQRELF